MRALSDVRIRQLGRFIPFVGVSDLGKNFVDYHYGVEVSEATTTRKAFSGESEVAFSLDYKLVVLATNNILSVPLLGQSISETDFWNRLDGQLPLGVVLDIQPEGSDKDEDDNGSTLAVILADLLYATQLVTEYLQLDMPNLRRRPQ